MTLSKKLYMTAPLALGVLGGGGLHAHHINADVLIPTNNKTTSVDVNTSNEASVLNKVSETKKIIVAKVVGSFSNEQLNILNQLSQRKGTKINIDSIKNSLTKISSDDQQTLFKANNVTNAFEFIFSQKSIQTELQNEYNEVKDLQSARKFNDKLNKLQSQVDNSTIKNNLNKLIQSNTNKLNEYKKQEKIKEDQRINDQKVQAELSKQKEQQSKSNNISSTNTTTNNQELTQNSTIQQSQQPEVSQPQSSVYVSHAGTHSDGNSYAFGNCTYGVKEYFPTSIGGLWGNATQWPDSARAEGYQVDHNPIPGSSIAVFQGGAVGSSPYYGHVAVIKAVQGDQVELYEMNVAGLGIYSTRWVSISTISQVIHV